MPHLSSPLRPPKKKKKIYFFTSKMNTVLWCPHHGCRGRRMSLCSHHGGGRDNIPSHLHPASIPAAHRAGFYSQIMPKNRFYSSLLGSFKHGERQTDRDSTSKFFQYGWRCTTNEDDYSNKTLIGNWNEERYDIQKIVQPKPLPSQVCASAFPHCEDNKPQLRCSSVT